MLSADLHGTRDEVVEIIAEPMLLKSYGVSLDAVRRGRRAGQQPRRGRRARGRRRAASRVKVPALIESPEDVLKIPVAASNADGGDARRRRRRSSRPSRTRPSITRVDGRPAVTIEMVKRAGANLIEIVDGVQGGDRATCRSAGRTAPGRVPAGPVEVHQGTCSTDLQNSVITGVLLVVVIILFFLGGRASIFIGIAIPFSFLVGILGLNMAGLTLNIVVLFSLILAVGMLVDDAIIVSEFAERRMSEGMKPREAYAFAASRMSGPVIAATLTRIAAFSPLLFWPGIVGQFMGYLPLTLIATLSASLVAALIFTPTLGALIGKAAAVQHETQRGARAST